MTTGQRLTLALITSAATHMKFTGGRGAAAANGIHGLSMNRQKPVGILSDKPIVILLKEGRELRVQRGSGGTGVAE